MIEMKKLIVVIHILLTVLLVGCATKGNYVGELKDGKPHGKGTLILSDGSKYVGKWKDDEPWNVTVYDIDGNILRRRIVNGVLK